MVRVVICILLAVFTMAILGCGGSDNPRIRVTGTVTPIIDGAMIKIYHQNHMYDEDHLVSTADVREDGTFDLYVPEEGVYDVVAMYPYGGPPVQWWHTELSSVTITQPFMDLGEIQLTPPV